MTESEAFALPGQWENWPAEHHETATELWIKFAKKPETRARRIEKFVAMLAAGEKIYP